MCFNLIDSTKGNEVGTKNFKRSNGIDCIPSPTWKKIQMEDHNNLFTFNSDGSI